MNETNLDRCRQFTTLCQEFGESPGNVALAWILRQEGITSVITGASSPSQLEENVAACELALNEEMAAKVEEIFTP